jgi:hypothetical protein
MPSSLRSRRLRWVAPLIVFGVIALIAAVPTMSAGAATPSLPPLTATALLDKVQAAHVEGLSGTVRLSTNLGIPDLSTLSNALGSNGGGDFSATSLLSGTHSARVWVSRDGFKATYSDSLTTEDDVIVNHTDLWTWQSHGTKVTHVVLPARQGKPAGTPNQPEAPKSPEANSPVKTPDQVAQSVLALVGPSTRVTVSEPAHVAGRPVYELTLAPRTAVSTVASINVAVDAATGLPVRVQIFANGPAKPVLAFDFGFTSLTIGAPKPSTFTFTPPPGSHVTTSTGDALRGAGRHAGPPESVSGTSTSRTVVGQDWATVGVYHDVQLPWTINRLLLRGSTPVQGGRLFSTTLVNVLVLDNGKVAVGAVSLNTLETAAVTAG